MRELKKYCMKVLNKVMALNCIVSNVFHTCFEKNALLVYITTPFTEGVHYFHQNQWTAYKLAQVLKELEYNVDVVDFNTIRTKYASKYDLVIDISPADSPPYMDALAKDCIKIAYLTGSNPSWANAREQERINAVNERRHSEITAKRQAKLISKEIENYTAVLSIGNTYNLKSYDEFNMPPVYFINNYGILHKIARNGFQPNTFCFIASTGQVHKGLDLLLEVFSQFCRDCELFIFSDFKRESDFCKVYRHELTECKNIHAIGFVDVNSKKFLSIIKKCSYMILPSCSEACAGSVCTAMGFGLIPIVSRECGFEDYEVEVLEDCKLSTIRDAVLYYSRKDQKWLKKQSDRSYGLILSKYNREEQTKKTISALKSVIENNSKVSV